MDVQFSCSRWNLAVALLEQLFAYKAVVRTTLGKQRIVRALLCNAPFFHADDFVSVLDRAQPVRHN